MRPTPLGARGGRERLGTTAKGEAGTFHSKHQRRLEKAHCSQRTQHRRRRHSQEPDARQNPEKTPNRAVDEGRHSRLPPPPSSLAAPRLQRLVTSPNTEQARVD
ncbi:unnamed protein product [Lampetra planeri]